MPSRHEASRTPANAGHYIRELDGIRGLAALMVFCHHTFALPGDWTGFTGYWVHLSAYGSYGVDLFFVLSGFLITSGLCQTRQSSSYWRDFYVKRALRILPLYLVVLAIAYVTWRQTTYAVLCLLFIANFGYIFRVSAFGPFWSLAIEEQFYLAWPSLVRRRSLRSLRVAALALLLLPIGLRVLFARFGHHDYYLTFLRCDGLAFGALLACHYQNRGIATARDRRHCLMLLSVLVGGVLLLGAGEHISRTSWPWLIWPAMQTGAGLVAGSAVGLTIRFSGSRLLAPLRSRVLVFFGLISYAMYMIHAYVLRCYDLWNRPSSLDRTHLVWMRAGTVLAATIALSLLSRYVIELPALSLRPQLLGRAYPPAEVQHPLVAKEDLS